MSRGVWKDINVIESLCHIYLTDALSLGPKRNGTKLIKLCKA